MTNRLFYTVLVIDDAHGTHPTIHATLENALSYLREYAIEAIREYEAVPPDVDPIEHHFCGDESWYVIDQQQVRGLEEQAT